MTQALFRDDAYLRECDAKVIGVDAATRAVILDRTVFYAMGGGQPGDIGVLRLASGAQIRVTDTRYSQDGSIVHGVATDDSLPAVGETVHAAIDWSRRYAHMRLHTALHLLCAVVKAPVTGGQIAADFARLDFDIEMEKLVKEAIESELNALVRADHPVRTRWVTDAELDARPELVKTMSVAPPRGAGRVRLLDIEGVDLQACGGTHVARSGEIGPLQVQKIRNEGRRNRRVVIAFA